MSKDNDKDECYLCDGTGETAPIGGPGLLPQPKTCSRCGGTGEA